MAGRDRVDVLVVGAGPGGCVAARGCARAGLRTVLVEKRGLPRDKVCTGMIMGAWAKDVIREEFGEIPARVLAGFYRGVLLHVGMDYSAWVPAHIPVGWRKNLDYWMCGKAKEAGAEVRENVRVKGVIDYGDRYGVEVEEEGEKAEIECRFVIGADGGLSEVRKFVYPHSKVRVRAALRECYEASLSIEKDAFHWFFPLRRPSPRFDVNYKDGLFLVEGGGMKEVRTEMRDILGGYGMAPDAKPVWRDACGVPILYDRLFEGSFIPARDNILLVGDAAGLAVPFTQEGIGSALKSGFLAAESVIEAIKGKGQTAGIYLRKLKEVTQFVRYIYDLQRGFRDEAKKGARALADAMQALVAETLKGG